MMIEFAQRPNILSYRGAVVAGLVIVCVCIQAALGAVSGPSGGADSEAVVCRQY